ncbi:hypothetical protein [Microcoleus sp. herbarium5]
MTPQGDRIDREIEVDRLWLNLVYIKGVKEAGSFRCDRLFQDFIHI